MLTVAVWQVQLGFMNIVQGRTIPIPEGLLTFSTDINIKPARLATLDLGLQVFKNGKYECRMTSTEADIQCSSRTFPVHPDIQKLDCAWECPKTALDCKCRACQLGDPVSVTHHAAHFATGV